MIRELFVRKDCIFCKGHEGGCRDCSGKGYTEEWVSIDELKKSLNTSYLVIEDVTIHDCKEHMVGQSPDY